MTPTTNHELLDEYKASIEDGKYTQLEVLCILDKIQSQLIEPMEYEIGKDYEFSGCNQKSWYRGVFSGFSFIQDGGNRGCLEYIRPITPISPEITSAISLLEATGEYTVTRK